MLGDIFQLPIWTIYLLNGVKSMINDINVKIETLYKEIEVQLEVNLEVAEQLISKYSGLLKDTRYYSLQATLMFYKGDIEKAIEKLNEGLKMHPFDYDMHFNLGFLLGETNEYAIGIRHYLLAAIYSIDEKDNKTAVENVERLIQESYSSGNQNINSDDLEKIKKEISIADGRVYPLNLNGKSLIRKITEIDQNNAYLVNMYKSYQIIDIDSQSRFYFKTELINGEKVSEFYSITTDCSFIIPLSLIEANTNIKIEFNDKITVLEQNSLSINKYHYIKFNESGKLTIKTDNTIFLGKPILLKRDINKPKLVMKIFVDGLAYTEIQNQRLEQLMPNTAAFFKDGFIAENCFINSEWTLPSKASINTGKYATKHRLLHPEYNYDFEKDNKLMAEYFKESDYYTTRIDTNWRTTAGFGYYKGFERLIYQNFLGGMDCRDVVLEAIEHLSSFKDTNNMITLSLMDLHNVPDEIENHLFSEVNTNISMKRNQRKKGPTSVLTEYDEVKIYKYQQEIKRVDIFLGILFDFLNKYYKKEEFVIVLHSDHGQTFLDKEGNLYNECRIKVPFMMLGKNVPNVVSNEIIETVDILPSILKFSDLELPTDIDGKLPKSLGGKDEREFAFTQIIHPNQPYRAIITEKDYTFILETKENVGNDLSISFSEYTTRYLNNETKKDESKKYLRKIDEFESYIFSHIKDFSRWDK